MDPLRSIETAAAELTAATRCAEPLTATWVQLRDEVTALLFAAIGRRDLDAARRLRDALQDAQPFIDRNLPELSVNGEAALALNELLHLVQVGSEALEQPQAEEVIAQPGDSTRSVIAILHSADTALTRGEVHQRLPNGVSHLTRARISQILEELVRLGFATRRRVAQGDRLTGYYSLSEAGEELSSKLEISLTSSADRSRRGASRVITGSGRYGGKTLAGPDYAKLVPSSLTSWSPELRSNAAARRR